ncbi:hypothetical protein [Anaeromyxobacter soli]|uniref:hypothetical protein n=1 Tax=Anaeromyxobacter soli TaxID=2922725 RepID=UPI001FAFAC0E|nr:hypothetical protein [Anaeromyxobacter sp. SG29]
MSPEAVLGPSLAGAVREIVRQELAARGAAAPTSPATPELISPEEAARRFKGRPSADTIRSLIHRGLVKRRVVSEVRDGGRPSYLVTVDEVLVALEASGKAASETEPVDLEAARARARERAGKTRGGR